MPKKSKKSTARTSVVSGSLRDAKKVNYEDLMAEDPQFYKGSSKFKFPNGDEYEGEFCAHSSGLVWRQGKGTYTTLEGQNYLGYWDGDKLDETREVEITYPDGSKYIGNLLKNKYSGAAIYRLEEKVSLMTNFVENKPSGVITIIDPNEKAWHGFAEKDESLLIPEHAFYRSIGKDLGKGRPRPTLIKSENIKDSQQQSDSNMADAPKYSDLRDIEKQVFAKSKKTPSGLELDSEWYQEYVDYRNTYGEIVCRAKQNGEISLTSEEYSWYLQYKEFEKKVTALLQSSKNKSKRGTVPDKLFEIIHSEEYRIRNKPVPVFYAREDSADTEDDCDSSCRC